MMIKVAVLSIQPKSQNKTVKWLDNHGIKDYAVFIPTEQGDKAISSYGDHALAYDVNKYLPEVDFMGTNIKRGRAVANCAVQDWCNRSGSTVLMLDDDYGGGVVSQFDGWDSDEKIGRLVHAMLSFYGRTGIEVGGYSAGAYPQPYRNCIMQAFVIAPEKEFKSHLKPVILNEDVASAIFAWNRGHAVFGLANVLRSSSQTGEMKKLEGNTKFIYQGDHSYRKSYGSVLANPKFAKIEQNWNRSGKDIDSFIYHHRIEWSKICPKIILENY